MDNAKSQLVDKLKSANNVLVTVSRDPSVDQLAACIGLTLLLNKLGKHAAAVFSGQVPSTLEFLKPEETLEKNTDSLRDFIIALDKSKADKLRYKVEDNVVRIFITPYRTSISQDDLEFSQGDFNVDVVIALGVTQQEDLDEAITVHGRILHDATVATINTANSGDLGSINWQDPQASSLSELVTELAQAIKGEGEAFDNQIATSLLTGIVAETDRFSNEKTSSQTMSASAALMAAGANQQLVASELDVSGGDDNVAGSGAKLPNDSPPSSNDGTLEIDHNGDEQTPSSFSETQTGNDTPDGPALELPKPEADDDDEDEEPEVGEHLSEGPKIMTEAPTLGGMLTANTQPEGLDPAVDPLTPVETDTQPQLLDHTPFAPQVDEAPAQPAPAFTPPPTSWAPPAAPEPPLTPDQPEPVASPGAPVFEQPAPSTPSEAPNLENFDDKSDQTLTELESAVHSTHAQQASEMADSAREEVTRALNSSPVMPAEPIQALNAQPLGDSLHASEQPAADQPPAEPEQPAPIGPMLTDILNPQNDANNGDGSPQVTDSTAPPPVPPPIPFQFNNPNPPTNPQQ